MFKLPTTATAPFCPSEVQGTIDVAPTLPFWQKLLRTAGPGLLISVGYMDPGNWATDIEAGAKFGYQLLFVVVLSSLAAIVLQCLSMRLGIVSGRDLARLCRERYSPPVARAMWLLAEVSIVACDLAEVLGSALAFKLLLQVPLLIGVGLTAFDLLIVLGLQGKGFRRIEAIILALVLTVGASFVVELLLIPPHWPDVARGLWPQPQTWSGTEPWYLAVGILGATVMPHNLYLHSSVVQTRVVRKDLPSKRAAIGLSRIDTIVSLLLALLINAAILILAGSAFHLHGQQSVADIQDAHRLLEPIVGTALAGTLFGIALLASGQSSTFTGTIAGQVLMEGFLELKIPCWQRRLITRGLALIPAFIGVALLGDHAVGKLLVLSQVVLSLQLPFAIFPLIRLTSDRKLMGELRNSWLTSGLSWLLFGAITGANLWLIADLL
ncbi:MAG: mntH [Nevskia sp.]|nr:mntH [Nevskia sp.]